MSGFDIFVVEKADVHDVDTLFRVSQFLELDMELNF